MDNLPANPLSDFVKQAQQHRRPQSRPEGGYLKFNGKTGQWTFGQEDVDVAGEEVLINVQSLQHGYVRWGEIPPAKAFTSISEAYPEKPEPIDGKDFEGRPMRFFADDARQFQGKFLDEGLGQFIYNASNKWHVENVDKLYDAILTKAQDETPYVYPLVELSNEFYKRATGKVYKPVFKIIGWCDVNGNPETARIAKEHAPDEVDDKEEGKEEDAPPRRRRRA